MQQDGSITKQDKISSYFKRKLMIRPPVDKDPRNFSPRMKSGIIACVSLVACTGGFTSTIYFPGLPFVTRDLDAPPIATTLTAALFVLFMGVMPLIWAAISEHYHIRRFLFLVSMVIYVASSIGAAFVQNIWALVVVRCIQSIGVSSGQSVGAGYIADLYPIEERGAAFGKYTFGTVFGPLLGPIIGGLLIMSKLEWRATFWFCCAFGIFIFLITFFFTPETYRDDAKFDLQLPMTSANGSKTTLNNDDGSSTNSTIIDTTEEEMDEKNKKKEEQEEVKPTPFIITEEKKKRFNPFAAFALLRHPFVILPAVAGGAFFGSMFAVEAILPAAFEGTYGLTSWQTGLCYLGAGIGNMSGAFVGSRLSDRLLLRSRRLRGGIAKAEDRLTMNIWIAGCLFSPLGLLIFGWVVQRELSFWGAIVAFGIQCFGNVQTVTAVTAYLVDSVQGRGAGVTAAASFVRFLFACILSLISTPMISKLGAGWTCTLFACLTWLGMFFVFIMKIRGENIRAWSGY